MRNMKAVIDEMTGQRLKYERDRMKTGEDLKILKLKENVNASEVDAKISGEKMKTDLAKAQVRMAEA
jgi:hypothetical protein